MRARSNSGGLQGLACSINGVHGVGVCAPLGNDRSRGRDPVDKGGEFGMLGVMVLIVGLLLMINPLEVYDLMGKLNHLHIGIYIFFSCQKTPRTNAWRTFESRSSLCVFIESLVDMFFSFFLFLFYFICL